MSTIKVDTIATRTGSGNITVSNNAVLSGDLTVDTSTLKVDSSNNRVGVGTASPTSDLHVSGGAGAHVAIQSSAGSHWRLGDAVGSSNGIFVVRDHTNSANRIQILANGKTQIAQGITFGSDTSDNNTMSDYEIGVYSPSYYGASTAGSQTYSTRHGSYVKIENLCQVWIDITLSAASGAGGTSNLSLPFAAASATPLNDGNSQNMGNWWFWDMNNNFTSGNTPSGWIPQGANYAHMYTTNGAASGHGNLGINTTGRIACSVIYFTA